MAIQLDDKKTADIFDTGSKSMDEAPKTGDVLNHPTNDAVAQALAAEQEAEDMHLAAEHKLVKVQAYIRDEKKAEKKSAVAERVAKHREKLKSEGLVQAAIPADIANSIKTAGGFAEWFETQKPAPVEKIVEVEVLGPERIVEKTVEIQVPGPERIIEKIVEVSVEKTLSRDEIQALEIGQSVKKLSGWRRALVNFAISS